MQAVSASRDRVAVALAFATFALHLAVANRYDLFRDELYFIVCGRHPQFGYADQPPLVPLLAAALYGLGAHLWVLRLPGALVAGATVYLAARIARFLGGGGAAAFAAGLAVAIAPMFLGIFGTFNTTVFEPLAWTAIAFGLIRAAVRDERRALLGCGIVAGIALEAKYALVMWLIALGAGLLCTPERRLFGRRELYGGLAIAVILALPSVLWQAAHGWPFLDVVAAAGGKNARVSPAAFVLNQVFVFNPLFAPLWIAGLVAPFAMRDLSRVRFVSVAFVVVVALTIVSHGKDYYVAAAYPAVLAIGAVAFERAIRFATARAAYLGAASVVSGLIAPIAMPLLAPEAVAPYMVRMHVSPQQQERGFAGTLLPQMFADQLGWRDFVREVAAAYRQIPARDRPRTAILVDNYGEAAALDVLGAQYGLPPALAGHNQYYLWGLRGQVPANVLRVQDDVARMRPYCAEITVFGTTSARYAMAYENGKVIALCRSVKPPLSTLWPELKNFS